MRVNEDNVETRTGAMPMAGALPALRLNSVTSRNSIRISGGSPQVPVLLAPLWMSQDSPKRAAWLCPDLGSQWPSTSL